MPHTPESPEPRSTGGPQVRLATLFVVSLGGIAGASLRFWLTERFEAPVPGFPWVTFSINLAGCLALGALVGRLTRVPSHPMVHPTLGTGFLGGFTTFSGYAVAINLMQHHGHTAAAVAFGMVMPLAAVAATYAGMIAVGHWPHLAYRRESPGEGE